jgi:cob(I)alamin adenosyltransferase
VEALGAVDELNAALGWAAALAAKPIRKIIERIQAELFDLGADVAAAKKDAPRVTPAHAFRLEKEIDALQARLPPLRKFILPGGSPAGAALHLSRAVCRRAERALIPLLKKKIVSRDAQIYLNRLSDHLFVLARTANRRAGASETTWES